MAGKMRTDERRTALRWCLVVLGWIACCFAWVSVLSFSIADAPSTTVWPNASPPHNLCGTVGAWIAYQCFAHVGLATYPVLCLLTLALMAASHRQRWIDLWLRGLGLALVCIACAGFATLLLEHTDRYLIWGPGGALGWVTAAFLLPNVQMLGSLLLLGLALAVGLLLAADNLVMGALRWMRWAGRTSAPALTRGRDAMAGALSNGVQTLSQRINQVRPSSPAAAPRAVARDADEEIEDRATARPGQLPLTFEPEAAGAAVGGSGNGRNGREPAPADDDGDDARGAPPPAIEPEVCDTAAAARAVRARPPAVRRPAPASTTAEDDAPYELPPLSLLDLPVPIDRASIEALCRDKARVLKQTLNEFRLDVDVVRIDTGPVITMFELALAPGIKVSQISSLSNDIARALKAPAVRVVAPLPGKNTIGIEVPNVDKEKVRLREVMEIAGERAEKLAIPLYLGKDPSGQPLVTDLTRMPHLLIAGTTGSGKSVCITSVIMSILMTRTPHEVQMILVDPKVVELSIYKDLPHLMCPIVTDVPKVEGILDWASTKMDERYALFAEVGVKDIGKYNQLDRAELQARLGASDDEMEKIPVQLPYIVIIIDELADLMMMSAKEVEFYLCRIAQKSRAVGIHLIVSTQRPQANVVTGLIKSNLPCRIAFRVSSRLDSRIVLDQNGAELLMGQGDMLFLPPGSAKLIRAQGTFVDDAELKQVVQSCKSQREPRYHPELVRMPGSAAAAATERDELFDQAVDVVLETGRGSVSLLQRRLTIGYGRASRLVDQMYEAGIVGEYKGSQAREIVVTREEWEAIKAQRDREMFEEASEEVTAD